MTYEPTTPEERLQQQRIDRAGAAMKAYRDIVIWGSDEENISDLLADLMHFVDALRVDREIDQDTVFDDLLETARANYDEEVKENEE